MNRPKHILTITAVALAAIVFSAHVWADEHEPIPLPACEFSHLVVNQCNPCLPRCYWIRGRCAQGETTCWVEDHYQRLCWEVSRPAQCDPCPCQCCTCATKGSGCGCEHPQPAAAVKTAVVAQETHVHAHVQQCPGGVCQVPAAAPVHRRFGGGHIAAGGNVESHRVVQLGAININRVADRDDDDGPGRSGPLRNILDKIRNRPSRPGR